MKNPQTRQKKTGYDFSKTEKSHPYKISLLLILAASTLLFLCITILYLATLTNVTIPADFKLPHSFSLGIILLLTSSFSLHRLKSAFKNDNYSLMKWLFTFILFSGLSFLMCQFSGWKQLIAIRSDLSFGMLLSFVFLLSGIHFLYTLSGLIYFLVLFLRARSHQEDPVKRLIYFSNKNQLIHLELASDYWFFINLSWVSIFIILLFTIG
ncbi:MAG: hypothetical protein LC117_05890 [Bacteroidia bacterium]|nr:hypothetical protein [Bacteroidia bacterium]MCZ2277441.1 hypothetical protein [Bacteroidia bacterium]